jgi:hypothetical protein
VDVLPAVYDNRWGHDVTIATNGENPPNSAEYIYAWGPRMKGWRGSLKQLDRKGERCRVIARGRMNSAMVEFADGERHVVSRNALRREK